MEAYPSELAAVDEARRLARVMTLKNACADLPYGGAKSVILKDDIVPGDDRSDRRQAQLGPSGGSSPASAARTSPGSTWARRWRTWRSSAGAWPTVSCDQEDPSPWTALGVFAGIRAALSSVGIALPGAHVVVQGAGHVGADLARRLAAAGCRVSVADVDPVRAHAVARDVGGRVVAPDAAVTTRCDVLAPCATARIIDRSTVDALRCRIVAGGANDVLATPDVAPMLADRGIVYVPDFVINAGGVIHIHALRAAWGPDKLEGSLLAIGDRVAAMLAQSERTGLHPPGRGRGHRVAPAGAPDRPSDLSRD